MQLVYALERPAEVSRFSLFLAGPSPRGNGEHDWRKLAVSFLEQIGFDGTVFIPLPRSGEYHPDYDHTAQIDWELEYLERASVIAFWIPRDLKTLPGFTTNVEFGRFSRTPCVLGYPKDAEKMRYLHRIAQIDEVPIRDTLERTLHTAIELLPL